MHFAFTNEEELLKPIKTLKGVGDVRARQFGRLGLMRVGDVLDYYPREYEDRTQIKTIDQLTDGEEASVRAVLVADMAESRPRGGLRLTRAVVGDGSAYLNLIWFNHDYVKKTVVKGREYCFFGKVKRLGAKIEMQNPEYEPWTGSSQGKLLPVYPLTKGLSQAHARKLVKEALNTAMPGAEEFLFPGFKSRFRLCGVKEALYGIHFPESAPQLEKARRRLVFDELLVLQTGLASMKRMNQAQPGISFKKADLSPLRKALPFELTQAQEKVFKEIEADMESSRRMNRLVQGDVGSGKTIVAVLAVVKAALSGFQSVLMAPTEILAEQHARSIIPLLEPMGIRTGLLTGGLKKREKEEMRQMAASGALDLLIGTHALLEESTGFLNLGLVITDEQHRFGVRQRALLSDKGGCPDLLVMTATPIPRTLSLVLYGDLDVSVIDALPPGRKPIKTYAVDDAKRERAYGFVKKLIEEGRQAYVVCPLVEDSEEVEAESAEGLFEKLSDGLLRGVRLGLIHGKMKPVEKESVMSRFSKGELDVLVSTTVIEVGVNVPNACVMVVENAERFGLAQLHQLRGRVGRGEHQSHCILFNRSDGKIARQRMEVLVKSTDGFVLSEKDLELRGPGDMFGIRQHGLPELKIANLYRDLDVLKEVQGAVAYMLETAGGQGEEAVECGRLALRLESVFNDRIKTLSLN